MKINKVIIKNYKSISHQEFEPNSGLNAFIGANSTGKSNIFNAMNWILGPTYPSFNSVTKEDHFLGKLENNILVRLEFDDDHSLELNEHKEVFNSYSQQIEVKSGLFYDDGDYNCKSETREKYCSAYLGVDRKILDYLPSSRWTLLGRILQDINKKFELETMAGRNGVIKAKKDHLRDSLNYIRDKLLFSVKDDSGQEIMTKFRDILQEESANQLNRPLTDFKVDLSLYDPWNFYKTLQLLVVEHDMDDLEFQASDLGMGVQASISVAILRAYSEINLANKSPIFIDEPELFLHPQAQRNFYKILRDLSKDKTDITGEIISEGTQVFFTTHSPNFLSAGHFNELFIVRKTKEKGTYLKFGSIKKFIEDLKNRKNLESNENDLLLHYKNAFENTGNSQMANEGFFAKKIILVEGQSEALVLPLFFDLIGFDYVREGISIVCCGGKVELDRFYRLYCEFAIPCFIIFDGDKNLDNTSEKEENIARNKVIFSLFSQSNLNYPDNAVHEKYLGFEYEFGQNIEIPTSKKGLDLFIEIKNKLNEGSIVVPEWVEKVRNSVLALKDSDFESILDCS